MSKGHLDCFNSMKVRLKHTICGIISSRTTMFQFHEGPIKTPLSRRRRVLPLPFQFHEGPIKTTQKKKPPACVMVSIP